MAASLWRCCSFTSKIPVSQLNFCRTLRGKPPGVAKSLDELIAYLNRSDPDLSKPVNIGYSVDTENDKDVRLRRMAYMQQRDATKLEKDARLRQLKIPLEDVKAEHDATRIHQLRLIAEHHGVFKDLFDSYAYFMPVVPMKITYDYNDDLVSVVHNGNHIKPSEATKAPNVQFNSAPDSLWTILLVNPDGHLADQSAEYLHWFVGNIRAGAVDNGEIICDYLQPFPPRGTGFHRLVFILYKQEKLLDYTAIKRSSPCQKADDRIERIQIVMLTLKHFKTVSRHAAYILEQFETLSLKDRTFRNQEFYRTYEDSLTPAGLAFFQCEWDETIPSFFHNILGTREPIYEYKHRMPYIKPQTCYPHREAFNLYLDRYRDPKALSKEVLLKRLKLVQPFKPDPPRPKYPLAYPVSKDLNSWKKTELRKERLRIGKYRDMDVRNIFAGD